ncbi:MAG: hypothetical protein V1875_01120 [Candidatus Altiarchaeota archaeon]
MAGEVRWRYSKVVGGIPQLLDVQMEAGVLIPKAATALMRQPMKVTDPAQIGRDSIRDLPDGSIVAQKVGAAGDQIFHFTTVEQKPRTPQNVVRPSSPSGLLDEGEEYLRGQAVQRYKAEFRLEAEAESFVLDALGKDNRGKMMEALSKVPDGEDDNLRLLHSVAQSMINLRLADDSTGRKFLQDILQVTGRVGRRH